MNVDSYNKSIDFSDSICTCKECNHKMSRDCFKLHCDCCKKEDHSMVMDGFEGFEATSKK
jgi:Zn finger protein HypA/HybF involved in hydrogenase expression